MQAKFYGGIYRASLAPTTYTEANMQYLGFDFKVHTWTGPGQYHSVRTRASQAPAHPVLGR